MRRFRGSSGTLAASVWVLTMLALAPSPAVAQQPDATPSAEELWREYPLEATPEAGARPTSQPASRAPTVRAERPPAPRDRGGPGVLLLIAAAIAAAGAVMAALAWIGWRARRTGALSSVETPLPSAPGATAVMRSDRPRRLALAASTERSGIIGDAPAQRRRTGGRPHGEDAAARSAEPPDVALAWTAEIEWHHEPGSSRFRIMARAGSSEQTAVSESEPLEWPPSGPDSLQALRHAVQQLEAGAVAAGWRPAPAGQAWYAKRFTWQPTRVATASASSAASSPVPSPLASNAQPLGTGRFKRRTAWLQGTEDLYRCEIAWEAGYARSRFRAMVSPPGGGRPVAAGASRPFKWLRTGEPNADSVDFRAEVERLADAMGAAGWQRAGRGEEWYAHRFVWRRKGPPPERIEPRAVTGAKGGRP